MPAGSPTPRRAAIRSMGYWTEPGRSARLRRSRRPQWVVGVEISEFEGTGQATVEELLDAVDPLLE